MTDARIVATNPADSSVVPVACNENGELLLAETSMDQFVEKDGDTMTGNLHMGDNIILNPDGSAQFANGAVDIYDDGRVDLSGNASLAGGLTGTTAAFSGQVTTGGDWSATPMGETFAARLGGASAFKFRGDITSGSLIDFHRGGAAFTNIVASIKYNGAADFKGDVVIGGSPSSTQGVQKGSSITASGLFYCATVNTGGPVFLARREGDVTDHIWMHSSGSAIFRKDVAVGSRNKIWTLVESGGLCHLVEYGTRKDFENNDVGEGNESDLTAPFEEGDYPDLRNIPEELDQLRSVVSALLTEVQRVEEKLRMAPEASWPVWDGSD